MKRSLLLATLLLGMVSSCSSVRTDSANLDALHGESGRYRYKARLTTPMREFFVGLVPGDSRLGRAVRPREQVVKNPARKSLELLLSLASVESSDPATRADQVRSFSWLALADPSGLVRERALLELGSLARQMDLDSRARDAAAAEPVNPAEFLSLLEGLYAALTPASSVERDLTETERADLEAACELLALRRWDAEGGRRLLREIASALRRGKRLRARLQPLVELAEQVEADLVAEALERGLFDDVLHVRAAAYRANHAAYGMPFLEASLAALITRPAAGSRFRVRQTQPGDELIFVTLFELLEECGIDRPEGLSVVAAIKREVELIRVPMMVAINQLLYPDRARTAAMLCLKRLVPEGPGSLRLEEWQAFWEEYEPAAQERIRLMESAQ